MKLKYPILKPSKRYEAGTEVEVLKADDLRVQKQWPRIKARPDGSTKSPLDYMAILFPGDETPMIVHRNYLTDKDSEVVRQRVCPNCKR